MKAKYIQFDDVTKSYKTIENAKKALDKGFSKLHMENAGVVRCTIIARDDGRFVPTVLMGNTDEIRMNISGFIHQGICVIG